MSSAIERSAVSLESGAKTKLATVMHGTMLAVAFLLLPQWFNMIPLSVLAAVLIVTGIQLASPERFLQVWRDGRYQFVPFVITFLAIVFTDLILGALVGLGVGIFFISIAISVDHYDGFSRNMWVERSFISNWGIRSVS